MRSIGMVPGAVALVTLVWAVACGSGDEEGANDGGGPGGNGLATGSACTTGADCASGRCVGGACAAASLAAEGGECITHGDCTTGSCIDGTCVVTLCTGDDDCPSGRCVDGICGGFVVGGGAEWIGGGAGYQPLTTGCGPETAASCTGDCESGVGAEPATVVRPIATLCFSGEGDPTPEDPSAVIEQVVEAIEEQTYVHLRVTFDPAYVDNTYGENASSGWFPDATTTEEAGGKAGKSGHTFKDLVGSDHTELLLTDGDGTTVLEMKVDLISESATAACGYETLGVTGGEGKVITGDPAAVLAVATSMTRNLNGCGYCAEDACGGDCTVNSPATDDAYTPNPDTPSWDYRQSYEVWIDVGAFGDAGFGQAYVTYTHASPSMVGNTLTVEPTPCPPDWCSGGECYGGTPPEGPPDDGGDCPPNYQLYVASEGEAGCTPIPFANYPGMAACPEGWVLDTASEGQYCLPAE